MNPEQLRAIRTTIGLTQGQLAEELGFSQGFIGEMERGEKAIERRTEYAVRYLLQRARAFPPRIRQRISEIAWQRWEDGWTAEIAGFAVFLRPATKGRWAIHLTHRDGYSVPWPRWEDSLDAAKASAVLHAQLGLLDLYDNERQS